MVKRIHKHATDRIKSYFTENSRPYFVEWEWKFMEMYNWNAINSWVVPSKLGKQNQSLRQSTWSIEMSRKETSFSSSFFHQISEENEDNMNMQLRVWHLNGDLCIEEMY